MGARARAIVTVTEGPQPLFVRVARAVIDDVRRGRLRAGDPLPGTRAVAASLGVNRNTVVAAYGELVAEGWAVTRPGGGTFVTDALPEARPRRSRREAARAGLAAEPGYALPAEGAAPFAAGYPPGTLMMMGGVPDVRLAPAGLIGRALRRAVTSPGGREALGYGDPRGDATLRAAIASYLRETRGVPAGASDVLVTRGSQMALTLVARALVPRGATVVVEATGYRQAWEAFARAGARLVPIAVDGQGIDVGALATLVARERVAAVYVTTHHQYPTTVTLAPGRRLALLALAASAHVAVVEDDYDHELRYEGRPVLPLASADAGGSVVYVGTLSKVLAPGLRLGYVVAPAPVIERLAGERAVVDRQGDHVVERAAAELLDDGTLARHARRARRVYGARRDCLVNALEGALGGRVEVRPPPGGLAVWAKVALRPAAVVSWERRALAAGVAFAAGARFSFDGRALPYARFGFATLDERELREAVRRLAAAWPR